MAIRKFYRQIYQKKHKKSIFVFRILKWFFGFFLLFFLGFLFLFIYYTKDLPRPEKFSERELSQSTKIYDRTGQTLLYEIFGEEKRIFVSLDKIPEHLKNAIIATEDANFYHHWGIDFKSIIRAILTDLKIKKFSQGGSTIPQQLIRSTFLSSKKTSKRKFQEIILSLELNRRYSKDQILEWYLNQIPFGKNSYGVEAASRIYFGKSISEISIPESAILAALIRAPSALSKEENRDKLLERKNYVLERMLKQGFIKSEELENFKKQEIGFSEIPQTILAPHFTLYLKDYLIEKYGESFLREKGLKIYSSLDWELQQEAEKIVSERTEINKKYHSFNAALTAINSVNGEILTMVGSKNFFNKPYPENCIPGKNCLFDPQTNVALRPRQPGSAFKPFVYATAFEKGYDDKIVVIDEQTNFGTIQNSYIPQNYDGLFRGPVNLRQALAQSLNIPSIKVLRDFAGLEDSIKTAKKFGITTLNNPPSFYGLPLVLGGGEVKLLEMVSAYGVFSTEGFFIPATPILKIEDPQGNIIKTNKKNLKRVLSIRSAKLINDILSDNEARAPVFGPHSFLYIENYKVAVKTGTTQDFKDAWTIGYTPSIVVGVWAGNNNNASMKGGMAAIAAAPIWKVFMEKILSKYPSEITPINQNKNNEESENLEE